MNRSVCCVLLAALGAIAACGDATTMPTTPPPPFTVTFSGGQLTAAIAASASARATGLKGRHTMAADSGMLFVFAGDQAVPPSVIAVGFYMDSTFLDLSIAFLDSAKTVISTDEMQAATLTVHYPPRPYRYALEANKGWFTSHGVSAGVSAAFSLPAGTVLTR
ncbi:MAG: DUF192 domain-containing protein [Gemmatimonadales bacterium]